MKTLILHDTVERYSLGSFIEYLEDTDGSVTFDDILTPGKIEWVRSQRQALSFGHTSSVYWLKFRIKDSSHTGKKWSLLLDYPLIDSIEFYTPVGNNAYARRTGGDLLPFNAREVFYRSNIFNLNNFSEEGPFYMRVESSSSMVLPLFIYSSKEQEKMIVTEQLLLGFYYGFLIVISLYSLFLFFSFRDVSYLIYICWITSYGFYQASINGLTFQYLWPMPTWWANNGLSFLLLMSAFFGLFFAQNFLRTAEKLPLANKIIRFCQAVTFIGIILSFIFTYKVLIPYIIAWSFFSVAVLIAVGIISIYNGNRTARFYIIAFCTFFLGTLIVGLKVSGILPSNWLTNWSQQIGSAMEVVLLSMALADRVNFVRSDKRKVEREKNEAQEKFEFLVKGTKSIIFILDEDWNFVYVNNAIQDHLKIMPGEITSKNFLDLICEDTEGGDITRKLVREKIELVTRSRKPVSFKAEFESRFKNEPKEMSVRMEYLSLHEKSEIFGQASSVEEDRLLKNFNCEKQQFTFGNYISNSEDISQRITRNLKKYRDSFQVSMLRMALREMIINAIEHGNLNISYEEKTESLNSNTYFDLISQRRLDPRYFDREVVIQYSLDSTKVEYSITDEGSGFNHEIIMAKQCDEANKNKHSHGRGIAMAVNIFDEVRYNDRGNQVTLVKYFTDMR
ncbi:MAG: PAS domain-containing protein [bacterium]|nr:PAS domain-containing protein [bacterium]